MRPASAMYESGLSGRVLPIHLKPQHDELLSSWLTRLSLAHGVNTRGLCAYLWPDKPMGTRDIDRYADHEAQAVLAQKTATSWQRTCATTLNAYEGRVFERLWPTGTTRWLLLNVMHGQRRCLPALQYCPQCLLSDAEPYFRRCWRLGFVTVCTTHRRRLLDRCPACTEPVNFHLLPGDTEIITRCYRCRFDVRGAEAPALDSTPLPQHLVTVQASLVEALATGHYALGKHGTVRPLHYLCVLHQLARLLVTRRDADQRRAALCRRSEQPFFQVHYPSPPWRAVEVLPVVDRFRLMLVLAWWLDEWPDRFIAVCLDTLLKPRELLAGVPCCPRWYEQAVQQVTWGRAQDTTLHRWYDEMAGGNPPRPLDPDRLRSALAASE